jgi:ATP-binding cassette subfamily B protein
MNDRVLFNDSVYYNVAYGDPSASREEVIEAAKKAQIHDTIMAMPARYESIVGERGLKLSGLSSRVVTLHSLSLDVSHTSGFFDSIVVGSSS